MKNCLHFYCVLTIPKSYLHLQVQSYAKLPCQIICKQNFDQILPFTDENDIPFSVPMSKAIFKLDHSNDSTIIAVDSIFMYPKLSVLLKCNNYVINHVKLSQMISRSHADSAKFVKGLSPRVAYLAVVSPLTSRLA